METDAASGAAFTRVFSRMKSEMVHGLGDYEDAGGTDVGTEIAPLAHFRIDDDIRSDDGRILVVRRAGHSGNSSHQGTDRE